MSIVDLNDPVIKEIVTARVKLLFEKPFFGQLAARLVIVDASSWCKTAATDGRHLYYNREFIKGLSKQELLFLLGHEVLHCFPAGTVIPGCWKPIEDVKIGDTVIGQGGAGSTVVNPMSALFQGKMFTIKAHGLLPQKMTNEHPVLTRRAKWKTVGSRKDGTRTSARQMSDPVWTNAENLTIGDWVQVPRIQGTVSDHDMQFEFKANAWSSPQKMRDGVRLDASVANFLGWYVAEGSTTLTKDNDFVSSIVLNRKAEFPIAIKLKEILHEKFGISSSIQERESTIVLQFSSAPLGRWLRENVGTGAKNKRIPDVILNNTDDQVLRSFMMGYVSGDGFVNDKNVNFGTSSKMLAYQMQALGARLGFLFGLHQRQQKVSFINGKQVLGDKLYHGYSSDPVAFDIMGKQSRATRPTSFVVVEDGAIWTQITNLQAEDVIGEPIYNIETSCHTYAAGNIMTHNCVYDHLGRRGGRDPKIWNMANDYIVNWTLKDQQVGQMPSMGLYDPKYTDDLHSEELYEILKKNSVTIKMPMDEHLDMDGSSDDDDADDDGSGSDQGDGKSKNGSGQKTVDVTVMGKDGPPKLTEADLQKIRNEIKAAVIQTAQQVGAGKVPAGVRRMISELIEPKMDWRALLDSHIRSSVKDDYTFQRVSRRSHGTGFILPAQDFMDTIDIAVSIDASGSMSETMLRDILSEVKGIMQTFRDFKLKLWTFDTKVYSFAEFSPENIDDIDTYALGGGGGTLFECNWEFMKANGLEPTRFVMFTDGYPGGSWGEESYCDTLFVIHGNDQIKAPFGITAYYDEKKP